MLTLPAGCQECCASREPIKVPVVIPCILRSAGWCNCHLYYLGGFMKISTSQGFSGLVAQAADAEEYIPS